MTYCTLCVMKKKPGVTAVGVCLSCQFALCKPCIKVHNSKLVSHEVLMYKHQSTEGDGASTRKCASHTGMELTYHCADCKTLICYVCLFTNHEEHQVSDVAETSAVMRKELSQAKKKLGTQISKYTSYADVEQHIAKAADQAIDNLVCKERIILNNMKRFSANYRTHIKVLESELQEELRRAVASEEGKMVSIKTLLEDLQTVEQKSDSVLLNRFTDVYDKIHEADQLTTSLAEQTLDIEFKDNRDNDVCPMKLDIGGNPLRLGELVVKSKSKDTSCIWQRIVDGPPNAVAPDRRYVTALHSDGRCVLFEYIPTNKHQDCGTDRWNVKDEFDETKRPKQYNAMTELYLERMSDLRSCKTDDNHQLLTDITDTFIEYDNIHPKNVWKDLAVIYDTFTKKRWRGLTANKSVVNFMEVHDEPAGLLRKLVRVQGVFTPADYSYNTHVDIFSSDIQKLRPQHGVFVKQLTVLYLRHLNGRDKNII